jgi:type I restriction enzyme, S subunit
VENNNQPEVRFSEFSESWNKVKLGNVFEQTSEYVNPKIKNIELWSLTVEKGLTPKTDRYNREFLVKKEDQFKAVSNYEFIYNPMNMTLGAVDLNLTGKQVAVSGYYITMKTTNGYDSNYFNIWLKSPLAIKMYKSFATGSLIEKQRVQFPTLSLIKASVPLINEQMKIGNFFKQLDETIDLHEKELTTLKQTKQGFLQKMFPKEGESVPEIRFPGFTGDWEQVRLGDRAIIKGRLGWKSLKQEEYIPEGPSMIAGKHIKNGVIDWDIVDHIPQWRYDESPEIMLKNGDVIFSKDGSLGNPALISDLNCSATINSTMMLVRVNETIDPSFFYQVMRSGRFERLIYLKVSGSSIPHLFQADMNDFLFVAPVKEEQIEIGMFFKQLDDNIALHQRKLDALIETKKAFLQKMFV